MGEMSAAQKERLWFLRAWESSGWRINLRKEAKWRKHLAALVKQGLLEQDGDGAVAMYRMTEAGYRVLAHAKAEAALTS